ncbi:MAG TPA: hypothetical protein VGL08_00765, partial [Paraburkholderia sp.]
MSIDGLPVVFPDYPDRFVQPLPLAGHTVQVRVPDLSVAMSRGTISHLAAWRLVLQAMQRTGFRGSAAIAFSLFMDLVETDSSLSVEEVALWLSGKYAVPHIDIDRSTEFPRWFASSETFVECFTWLADGACKRVYRGRFNPRIVLCTALSKENTEAVRSECEKLAELRTLGLTVPRVSPCFPAPLPEELNVDSERLSLSGVGFLEEFVQGIFLKPWTGVIYTKDPTFSKNQTKANSKVVAAAMSNGVWSNIHRLGVLVADFRRLWQAHAEKRLSLVDLQGFVCADGHFVITDPSSGEATLHGNQQHLSHLNILIAVL